MRLQFWSQLHGREYLAFLEVINPRKKIHLPQTLASDYEFCCSGTVLSGDNQFEILQDLLPCASAKLG
ncbi:MAG: hypothetical protein CBE43_00620 [Rhodopirellula sp. TMED283]|nr:MAG: hypothetical protein CBE43_00620 [Rhodopirellula sp. TMED283]